jgi:eukaryotic-like serine/threonine-protein kinase
MTRPADALLGKEVGTGWKVESVIRKDPKGTGGRFSTGYIVSKDGKKAFLKAMDLSEALLQPDQLAALRFFAEMIQFEGDVLTECRDRRMSKIVQLIEGGNLESDQADENPIAAAASRVYFYIFELADSDVRKSFSSPDDTSCAAKLHALHHVALAIQQLHGSGIAHQDIKPSNVVCFSGDEHKVADLGRASIIGKVGPTDSMPFAGDLDYMPPEFAYGYFPAEAIDRRLGTDVYLLGSLLSFLFTLQGATALLRQALPPDYLPGIWSPGAKGWAGTFTDALPQLVLAHSRVCEYVSSQIPEFCRDVLLNSFRELTHPDPHVRGNPKARRMVGKTHGLDRYVSLFDRLEKLAMVNQKHKRNAPAI